MMILELIITPNRLMVVRVMIGFMEETVTIPIYLMRVTVAMLFMI